MVSDALRGSVRWPKAPNGLGNALGAWPPISAPRVEVQLNGVAPALGDLLRNLLCLAQHTGPDSDLGDPLRRLEGICGRRRT